MWKRRLEAKLYRAAYAGAHGKQEVGSQLIGITPGCDREMAAPGVLERVGYAGFLAAAFARPCSARVSCLSRSSLALSTSRLATTITGGKR